MGAAARVLIVDDDWLAVTTTKMLLAHLGYDIVGVATNGADAVARGRSLRPDLILMDVQMPVLDGVQAARTLMLEQPTCVLLVSGKDCLVDLAEQAGAMGCAPKPLWEDQVPALFAQAQQRFARFRRVAEEAANPEEALRQWTVLQRAVLAQSAALHITEEQAFRQLWRRPAKRAATPRVRPPSRPKNRRPSDPAPKLATNGV